MAGGSGRKAGDGPLHEISDDGWAFTLQLNLTSLFYSNRAAVQQFLKQGTGGSILNMGSVLGFSPSPRFFSTHAYATTKAAVIGLTKSLGKELAETGIRVNCVTPAAARTDIFAQMNEAQIAYMLSKIPMARFVRVEEIAALVAWLASEECSFSTGGVFDISGGRATY